MQGPFAVIIRDKREDQKKTFEAKDATPTDQTRHQTETKRAYRKAQEMVAGTERERIRQ
jgi:hypothetical protein